MKLINVLDADYTTVISHNNLSNENFDFKLKSAFLRDLTIEPLIPFIKYQCITKNIFSETYINDYGTVMQEILDQNSNLYSFKPEIIYIFPDINNLLDEKVLLKNRNNDEKLIKKINEIEIYFENIIDSIRIHSDAIIVISSIIENPNTLNSIQEFKNPKGKNYLIKEINNRIFNKTKNSQNTYVLNLSSIISRIGYNQFYDNRSYHMSKNPFSTIALRHIAFECVKYISSLKGLSKKCIVLDCDNTLWGGVLGEDGLNNLKCGKEYPGSFFLNFQKKLLQLKNNGVLLALNSKNNYDDVIDALENHSEIILKKRDFAAMRINWNDKAKNLIEISHELNISLDHMIFIDDSSFEIGLVNKTLPNVEIIQVPENLDELERVFENTDYFENLSLSSEDNNRTELYLAEKDRKESKKLNINLDNYFEELHLCTKSSFAKVSEIPRISQLTQKTNQFNLTTKRYNQREIENFINSKDYDILTFEAEDKFGPYGLIGVVILAYENNNMKIDTFLMSCRALGRGIEKVMLSNCFNIANSKKIKSIYSSFIQTKKNHQVRDFYQKNHFEIIRDEETVSEYKLSEYNNKNIVPEYIVTKTK